MGKKKKRNRATAPLPTNDAIKHPENVGPMQFGVLKPASQAAYDASVQLKDPVTTRSVDGFSNPVARLGQETQNLLQATVYPMQRLTQNYGLLNSLYRNNWIVQNIIGTIPEDVTKRWFRLNANLPPDYVEKFDRMQRVTKLRKSIVEGMKWGRLYGGAVGLILIDGQDDLSEELDYDTIMPDSFQGLYIVDRWQGVSPSLELIQDPSDPWFSYPMYYQIVDQSNGAILYKVHHTRVVRFIGRELPYFERIAEQWWGQSEIESIYEEIVKRDNVSNNIASLTFKANLSVYEMEGIDQLLALGGSELQKRFWNTLQAQSVLESNLGTRVINKGDTLHQLQYNFAGLKDVYELIQMDVAGAARTPVTKLFGRSPTGFQATGEADLQNYYDYLDEKRESDFRPIIEQLLPIMALSAWGEIPDDLDFTFDSIRTMTEKEKSEIAQLKVNSILDAFTGGIMTQEAATKELMQLPDTTGMFTNVTDEMAEHGADVWAKNFDELHDPLSGLSPSFPYESNTEETVIEE